MKKIILLFLTLSVCCLYVSAQKKIVLRTPKMQHVEAELYDQDNNFLMNLPLTFSITNKNVLTMMVGRDMPLNKEQSVWFFSNEILLKDFLKINKNLSASSAFKKQNAELNAMLLPNRKIELYRLFDDGYEMVKINSKPVFFEINSAATQPITFYMQLYVAKPNKNSNYILIAKCKPIEIELITK